MKIRKGFVSNSSSSSFICEVCGSAESGYDMSTRDAGFYRCVSGHEFCESHLVEVDLDAMKENALVFIREKNIKNTILGHVRVTEEEVCEAENVEELNELFCNKFDGVPEACCPVCSLESVRDNDLLNYVLKMSNISKDKLTEQLKQDYPTFEGLMEFLYGEEK